MSGIVKSAGDARSLIVNDPFVARLQSWVPKSALTDKFNGRWFVGHAMHQIDKVYSDHERKRRKNKDLGPLQIVPGSLVTAMVTFAITGLAPVSALGLGYLVPFTPGRSAYTIITPIIGYKGYIQLARSSPSVSVRELRAGCILDGDEFDRSIAVEEALSRFLPAVDAMPSPENLLHAFALYRAADAHGEFRLAHVMPRAHIEKVRRFSKAKNGPWQEWYGQMAAKTPVRRMITAGEVRVNYLAGVAAAAESAAEGGDIRSMRAALASAEGSGSWVDEAAHEVEDYIDVEPEPGPAPADVAERDTKPAKARAAREIHDEIGKCTSLARLSEVEAEIDRGPAADRDFLFDKLVERREVLEERGA